MRTIVISNLYEVQVATRSIELREHQLEKREIASGGVMSTESEYMALQEATQEAVWLKTFLCELGEMASDEAIKTYEDNKDYITLTKNPQFHKCTK